MMSASNDDADDARWRGWTGIGARWLLARLREARAQTGCERHSRPTTNTCARSAGPLVPAAREDVGTGCLAQVPTALCYYDPVDELAASSTAHDPGPPAG